MKRRFIYNLENCSFDQDGIGGDETVQFSRPGLSLGSSDFSLIA